MICYGAAAAQDSLQAFNQCLLQLGRLPRERDAAQFIADALQLLRDLVPFDSAWWGELSAPQAGAQPQNWMHGRIGLSESFVAEWRQIAARDSFCHDTLSRPGEVLRASGFGDPCAAVNDFARRHDLYHLLTITFELPESGLMFFICLYRGVAGRAFSDAEANLFSSFCDHLLQLWRFQLQDLLRLAPSDAASDFAVATQDGRLLYIGARLCSCIAAVEPDWSGSLLPASLLEQVPRAPCVVRLGRGNLTLTVVGEQVLLALSAASRSTALAPRERSAAMLFAAGHSYKEIARMLALSPATVRTYLRNCYLQLGVRSKVELGSILRLSPPLPTTPGQVRSAPGARSCLGPPHL
ncbi:helix-turn-helix transcriptional regulator [Pseudomonas alcaligenes]|uniref:Helix-turn-helix transcriptional regulator n=1 Tax=Aquipseudomonas alcaligenes TaxID=43263 RepID=A0ABR7RYP3_AQUAC|nr:helix-turn-helix transcriptional regulator [Pseudomonas alcaligenes]MBC9249363.1 helix-turn-helix transcriptional regulator [Pseudomonas alcaligenes]